MLSVSFVKKIAILFERKIGLRGDAFTDQVWKSFIIQRMKKLRIDKADAYYDYLIKSEEELGIFTDLLTVPETWFFRESIALEYAVNLIALKGKAKTVRVLSVACSTGEEPYSLVMMLLANQIPSSYYEVDGVDICSESIEIARLGEYRKNSFRGSKQCVESPFFDKLEHKYLLKEKVKGRVRFIVDNIINPDFMKRYGQYDIIFCRNLLIYLSKKAVADLLDKFSHLLNSEGILLVGSSEVETVRASGWKSVGAISRCAFAYSHQKESISSEPENTPSPQRPILDPASRPSIDPLERASQLANEGLYSEAFDLCNQYRISLGTTDAKTYFLMGVIKHACGEMDSAEAFFIKAIYLQPDHIEALTYLTLLAEHNENEKKAALYRKRLNRIVGSHD